MKIPPSCKLTKTVWNYLSLINHKHRILMRENEIPEKTWQKIISLNILQSSLFSAKVEGNPLELKDISRLSIKKKEHLEIRNLIRAIKYIKKNIHFQQKITIKFIARLHYLAMSKIDENAGKIRTKQNAIFNQAGYVVYMPPPPDEANKLLKRLIKYINSQKHSSTPLVKALLVHFAFEKIHPFIDGNGRVGRLLIYSILKIFGEDVLKGISFEEKLNREKETYYSCLDKQDATSFLEFMLEIILASFNEGMQKFQGRGQSKLTDDLLPRREEIFHIIKDHKIVSVDFLKRRFQDVSERTLRNDLADLAERKLVVKLGNTRGAAYKIKD